MSAEIHLPSPWTPWKIGLLVETMLGDQRPEGAGEMGGNRHDAFPTALAVQKHLRPGPVEMEIVDIYGQCFRYSGAGESGAAESASLDAATT